MHEWRHTSAKSRELGHLTGYSSRPGPLYSGIGSESNPAKPRKCNSRAEAKSTEPPNGCPSESGEVWPTRIWCQMTTTHLLSNPVDASLWAISDKMLHRHYSPETASP